MYTVQSVESYQCGASSTGKFTGLPSPSLPPVFQALPDILYSDGRIKIIVEGSVVWLYCHLDSDRSVRWSRERSYLIPDFPHIRLRNYTNSDNSTIHILIVDNFRTSDNGIYQCIPMEKGIEYIASSVALTGIVAPVIRSERWGEVGLKCAFFIL